VILVLQIAGGILVAGAILAFIGGVRSQLEEQNYFRTMQPVWKAHDDTFKAWHAANCPEKYWALAFMDYQAATRQ
jgi:hypothetical protein